MSWVFKGEFNVGNFNGDELFVESLFKICSDINKMLNKNHKKRFKQD